MMTGDVPGKIASATIPPFVWRGFWSESCALPIERQHAIRFERQQIRRRQLLRMFERTTGQSHAGERNRIRLPACRDDARRRG